MILGVLVVNEVGDQIAFLDGDAGFLMDDAAFTAAGADAHDQARVATPEQALTDGANLLVIGRQITGAADPGAAAASLAAAIRRFSRGASRASS